MARRLVVIGGSAGAIEALREVLPLLSSEWASAFAIVLHRQAVEEGQRLETLLAHWSALPLKKASDGDRIRSGEVVVCPSNVHLIFADGRYRLTAGPRENHCRPSIDVSFRSLADEYGPNGLGIVLSGLLDDGAAGTQYLRARGGITIAQDPAEAQHLSMPRAAIRAGAQVTARLADMPKHIDAFARRSASAIAIAVPGNHTYDTRFTCPDCNGVLVAKEQGGMLFYRCRVGHAFSPGTLDQEKDRRVEAALWTAVEVLEEQAELAERSALRVRSQGNGELAERMEKRAQRNRERALIVRDALPQADSAIEDSEIRGAMY